jgi:NMD protein affecting ribosome stability and mRNA decay
MKTPLPTVKITIEIQSCSQCKFKGERNPWSSDGWDRMIDWHCTKNDQTIQKAVEWHEEKKSPFPHGASKELDHT